MHCPHHLRPTRAAAAVVAASVFLLAKPAFADAPPTAEDFGGSPQGGSQVGPSSAPSPATIRVVFAKKKKRAEARIYREDAAGRDVLVCAPPCTAELPPGVTLRAVVGEGEPHTFTLEGVSGRRTDVMVGTPPRGGLALGIVLTSLGGATMVVGGALAMVGALFDDNELVLPGLVTAGVGGIVTFGGVTLIANRATEPRVYQDVASTMRMNEAKLLPRVSTPTLTFAF